MVLEVLARTIRQEKETKASKQERVKWNFLFAIDMILCIENLKIPPPTKTTVRTNTLCKVAG